MRIVVRTHLRGWLQAGLAGGRGVRRCRVGIGLKAEKVRGGGQTWDYFIS